MEPKPYRQTPPPQPWQRLLAPMGQTGGAEPLWVTVATRVQVTCSVFPEEGRMCSFVRHVINGTTKTPEKVPELVTPGRHTLIHTNSQSIIVDRRAC
ncbi:unnamed protein product [Boreogadus saida]